MYIRKGVAIIVFVLMSSIVGVCQESGVFTDSKVYTVGDTIKVNFFFEDKFVLGSNGGGCGGGLEYAIICHTNDIQTLAPEPSCDYLLMEYFYQQEGSFELPIYTTGVYSVLLYVVNNDDAQNTEPDYKNVVYSEKFEVSAKE